MQGNLQNLKDEPIVLPVGSQVSAKYKGAFCEAKIRTVAKNIKVKVAFKKGGSATVSDEEIIGEIRVGNSVKVEVKDPDKKDPEEATVVKIQDCSQYTVVFDDGDITTLRRSALCRQSGKHFNASDTLDQLPLTHPEHRGAKRSKTQDEWSDEDEEYCIGKVVCVENTDTKKKNSKESYFPALIVAPKAQESAKINIKSEYLVRSFKDGRYYTVPKKEVTEFNNDTSQRSDNVAVQAAREFLDKNVMPNHWDREVLLDSAFSDQELSDSSDDEPNEVKDRFFAQLLEFMEKRNSPLNKSPSITNRDVDLYRLYYSVEKLGGYANVTKIRSWKAIAKRLGFTPTDAIVKLVKHSYRKFLLAFEEAVSKGIEELPPKTTREKGRSSIFGSSSNISDVCTSTSTKRKPEKVSTSSAPDDSENTSESTKFSSKRRLSSASVTSKVKVEEKTVKEKPCKDDESSASNSAVASASAKKDKAKKKPANTNKKKEDSEVKKEVVVAKGTPSGPTIPEDVPIEVDDRLKVYYRGSSDYEAKVLEISEQDGKKIFRVHYKGWNARYDEWIPRESIAENLSKDEVKNKSKSTGSKNPTPNSLTPSNKNPATGKRARNRADTTASSRSTTPLSNTSSSKAKVGLKRSARNAPPKDSRKKSLDDDVNSSESDEPIKKMMINKEEKLKQIKTEEKGSKQKDTPTESAKSEDEKLANLENVKGKMKSLQRDSSRSSFHSTDSDSSVPSDVPNSSKSAYTSENESNLNEPEKSTVAVVKPEKKSFAFGEESTGETSKHETSQFNDKKSNIFTDKKLTQQQRVASENKVGRFGQMAKEKEQKDESDVYEFKDEEKDFSEKLHEKTTPSKKTQEKTQSQRKQAKVTAIKEESNMEDIESMIKTSTIVQSNKRIKKSTVKEEKSSAAAAKTQQSSSFTNWPSSQSSKNAKPDTTFDVLRKSPSFNVQPTVDDKKSTFGSSSDTHELLRPIMVPSNDDDKPEIEVFKRILEPTFDVPLKTEKSSSIVDKLLKSMSKKETETNESAVETTSTSQKDIPPSDSYTFEVKSPIASTTNVKKPIILSPDPAKIDEDSKPINQELKGTIQKLENAIQQSNIGLSSKNKAADDSDTDSDPRLIIEDENDKMTTQTVNEDTTTKEGEKKAEEQTSETMSLLLCEETIPGSPAPLPTKDALYDIGRSPPSSSGFVHPPNIPSQTSSNYLKYSVSMAALNNQMYHSNVKNLPDDSDGLENGAQGGILREKLNKERGSATSSGNNTNNNSDKDSLEDQSDNDKNREKKRKRSSKQDYDAMPKKKRQTVRANVRGNLNMHGNDSDSNDNSDVNISRPQIEVSSNPNAKALFNFLVELDPNMHTTHRIGILEKKIQELKKTYLMIKNEMNAKDRRRKKMKRRDRENKQKQTLKPT